MGVLDFIGTMGNILLEANKKAQEEKRREELRKGSIDAEFKVISDEKIEPKQLR